MNEKGLQRKYCPQSSLNDGNTASFLYRTRARPAIHRTNRIGVPHPLAVGMSVHQPCIHRSTKEATYQIGRETFLPRPRGIPSRKTLDWDRDGSRHICRTNGGVRSAGLLPYASRRTEPLLELHTFITHSFAVGTPGRTPSAVI